LHSIRTLYGATMKHTFSHSDRLSRFLSEEDAEASTDILPAVVAESPAPATRQGALRRLMAWLAEPMKEGE